MVDRFDGSREMQPYKNGDFVLYSDYAALKAENERLAIELDAANIVKREAIAGWKDAERALAERAGGVKERVAEAFREFCIHDWNRPHWWGSDDTDRFVARLAARLTTEPAAPAASPLDGDEPQQEADHNLAALPFDREQQGNGVATAQGEPVGQEIVETVEHGASVAQAGLAVPSNRVSRFSAAPEGRREAEPIDMGPSYDAELSICRTLDALRNGLTEEAFEQANEALIAVRTTRPSEQAVTVDWKRVDDALVSCAGLLRTLCRDEIGDTAAAELEYVRTAVKAAMEAGR